MKWKWNSDTIDALYKKKCGRCNKSLWEERNLLVDLDDKTFHASCALDKLTESQAEPLGWNGQ